ncbi:MAG: M48 family metallopeptidase [Acidiferrobacterales bacterium]|nr:M48 family metallopeptidase [Acidiferrobacterales bacterium]
MIKGKWYAKGSAAQRDAVLHLDQDYFTLNISAVDTLEGRVSELKINDRLGNVERKITLKDGSIFATFENDSVDALTSKSSFVNGFLHHIESNLAWVAVALIVTILTTGAFFKWGLPWSSNKIAHALPHKTNEIIASHTLDFLDEYFFEENSDVDPEIAEQIRRHFHANLVPLEIIATDIEYRLHFRKWEFDEEGIPNALALPSGDIVLTDKFVELCENQNEIDAVLLHEMGHVVHRHSLQMLIQGTLITTIIMVATGDSNGLADLGLGLGSVLIASGYSRGHETEADIYAFEKMLKAGVDPQAFSTIMDRMTQYMEDLGEESQDFEETAESEGQTDKPVKSDEPSTSGESGEGAKLAEQQKSSFLDYLASHPNTDDRIALANHYSECFHKALDVCPPFRQE